MRLIDADDIQYDQLLNTGNKEHPLEWAVSQSSIDSMPTIKADVIKHGHWVDLHCSVCGKIGWMDEDDYCPNCGARMDL